MEWLDRSLGDLYRILVALEHGGGDPLIQGLIDREPLPTDFVHARITLRSLLQLLEQTGGSTWLPEEVVSFLRTLNQEPGTLPAPAGVGGVAPAVITTPTAYITPLGAILFDNTPSLAALAHLANIGWVHNQINSVNFPEVVAGMPLGTARGGALSAIAFNRAVNSGEALANMFQRLLRPATLRELLILLAHQPALSQQYSFAALGSYFDDGDNGRRYPFVNHFGPDGCIQLSLGKHGETDLPWTKGTFFVVAQRI